MGPVLFIFNIGRTHGAPYRGYGYVPLRFGGWGGGGAENGNTTTIIFNSDSVRICFRLEDVK